MSTDFSLNDISPNEYIESPDTIINTCKYEREPKLLENFIWDRLDLTVPDIQKEVSDFLVNYYVEDSENTYRLYYSPQFLKWALIVPGFYGEWFLGVRLETNRKLVACIMGTPITVRIYNKEVKSAEINFLCIHPKLRHHRLTSILTYAIAREIVLKERYHSIYTGGKLLIGRPTLSINQFYHRYLNVKKLYEMNFFSLKPQTTLSMMIKMYCVPEKTKYEWVPLIHEDLQQIMNLIQEYFRRFHIVPIWSIDEIAHYLLPKDEILYTYVRKNSQTMEITDMMSFYELKSIITKNCKYNELRAAWTWYMIPG